jgi:phosphoglycolate phosphatase-like HAD superfamily hydrolase
MARPSERPPRVRSGILFIFDLDGTLYRTETSFLPAVLEVFRQQGLASPDRDDVMSLVGEPLARQNEWLGAHGLPKEALPLLEEAEFRLIRDAGELYPGVFEALACLRERGHTLVICTNGREVYARAVLEACGILDLFDEVRARRPEDADKAGMVADLLSRIPHQRAIVVGDRFHDVLAARANGCLAVGAAYGYARPGELAGADCVLSPFRALLELQWSLGPAPRPPAEAQHPAMGPW